MYFKAHKKITDGTIQCYAESKSSEKKIFPAASYILSYSIVGSFGCLLHTKLAAFVAC